MFGKKKNKEVDSGNPTESKKKSKTKGSASKNRVTANRGPNFLVAHVEKMIMVIVAGLAGFMVYRNVSLPTLPNSQTPEQLAGEAQNLLNKVRNESHWEAMYAEREQFDRHKFHANTLESRHPADPTNYTIGRLEPSAVKEHYEQRTDPVLLPAEQIFVRNVSGTLGTWVLVNDRNRDPFLDIKDADPIGRKSDSGRNNRRGGGNNRADSEESPFGPGTNTTPQRRTLKAKYDLGAQLGSTMGGMGGMGGMDSGGRGGDAGMGPGGFGMGDSGGDAGAETGTGPGRTDNDVGGILLGSGPQRSSTGELLSDQQRIRYRLGSTPVVFNSITALIPHRKNEEEYFRAFSKTGTFLAGRDIPVYLGIEVQRVEVTGNPSREIQEEEWKTILTNREIQDIPKKLRWATHLPDMRPKLIPDIIHTQYSLFGLTAPIVPLLVRDYREFSKHPKIEWRWNTRLPRPPKRPGNTTSGSDDESDVVFGQGGSGTGGMGTGPGGFGGGGFGGGGYGDEGRGDGGFGGPGGMGMDGGGFGGGDFGGGDMMGGGYGEEGGRGDDFGFGGGGMGMGGPGGGGGFGAGGRTEASIALLPEYKMVRVYDFLRFEDVGRSFRYRMRIAMRDPNYPENQDYFGPKYAATALPPPSNDELSHEVYERVSALRKQEDKMITEAVEKKIYKARSMRYTPWSQASPPISVATPVEAFAGDIDPKGVATLAVTELHLSQQFPGAVMAREMVAKRGSLLGVPQSNTEFISPTLKIVKQAEKYSLLTGAVLVDMRGGQPLSGHSEKDDPQRIEGEAMILRPDGSLFFTSDLDDQFLYRMYTFQDDKEAAKARQNSGDRGGAGFGEGGLDGGGGPGGEGR